MAAGFPPINSVVKMDCKQAAVACLGSAAAHYSSLIAEKRALVSAFGVVSEGGNLLDNDRLLFLELARRGPLLVNLVPEVFVRFHTAQEQQSFSARSYRGHAGATTRAILQFCEGEGIDVVAEFERLHRECPIPEDRPKLFNAIAPGVMRELRRSHPEAVSRIARRHWNGKWLARQLCPSFLWEAARLRKTALRDTRERTTGLR